MANSPAGRASNVGTGAPDRAGGRRGPRAGGITRSAALPGGRVLQHAAASVTGTPAEPAMWSSSRPGGSARLTRVGRLTLTDTTCGGGRAVGYGRGRQVLAGW